MASIQELKARIDLHDLAQKLGLKRPGGSGNYASPHHADKSPSLSVFADGKAWKDFSDDVGGDCISLVRYVENIPDVPTAMRRLHDLYSIPIERSQDPRPQQRERSKVEYIADECKRDALTSAVPYLVSRGVSESTAQFAVMRGAVGFNNWTSTKVERGQVGFGGPAVAFVCRDAVDGRVRAVDFRYIEPELNGGLKTKSLGDKDGVPYFVDRERLRRARTVYIVESAINALCIEACDLPLTAAIALRGVGAVDGIDWRMLQGKQVVLALDADKPNEKGRRPGPEAAWQVYDLLTAQNIGAMLVDQAEWYKADLNDVADIAARLGRDNLKDWLRVFEPWAIPGLPGKDMPGGKNRVYLPAHDFAIYWRYRCKPDFVTCISKVKTGEDGAEQPEFEDVAGFRIASISRVTIQSATATMSGEDDAQPQTLFAVAVQTPRHGATLLRRVFSDDRLHNVEHWKKVGPVFSQSRFLRLVNILERSADCGAREALNFVGLAWRHGKPVINEGPDCYFTEPEKQCPYYNLAFPSGPIADAKRVIAAYQETFRDNAAALLLTWALGGHLKAFLGFWPHQIMQADKGSGKSTLVKRLERSIGMTMFGGQSLQTEFRLLTSVSHTSHPVGWEEISARKQDVINVAVAMLQESYQHTITRRGSDLTEFLISAPVLLAGEDVPVRSLTGKVVRCNLTGRRGPLMAESLPRFPVRQWLEFLATLDRDRVQGLLAAAEKRAWSGARAAPDESENVHVPLSTDIDQDAQQGKRSDAGASRMVRNYAALSVAWRLLCEFADVPVEQGGFLNDLRREMNSHIKDTSGDREPWVWILELVLSDIESRQFMHPHLFDIVDGEDCVLLRPQHIMDHISTTARLREHWNALPIKSARVFKRQMENAGVIVKDELDKRIGGRRHAHLTALGLKQLAEFGLEVSVPDEQQSGMHYPRAANK